MPTPKWLVVARNEYRIHTSRIRRIRRFFPFLAAGLLLIYVAFLAPVFVHLFVEDFLALLLSNAALAMVQIILFTIFVYFMIIPVTNTLREEQTRQLEIFLAAPIKPSDLLLGEFLGLLPFYAIFVTVITGIFTGFLAPRGLDIVQISLTVVVFIVTFLSGSWIGTVIAAVLRTKLGRIAHGKDVGRALAMIIALPMVALIYAIQFGGLSQTLANPEASGVVSALLGLLPSSWGAEVIVDFAVKPGNIGAVGFDTFTKFAGLIAFFGSSLLLGAKLADRAYSLEPMTFTSSTAKPDGIFYKSVRYMGGNASFGTLLVSIIKDYSRRLENLSNLTYMVGLLLLMSIFVVPSIKSESVFIYRIAPLMFIVPIVVIMITGDVTVQGKVNLFIFRKAPYGEGRFVKAMLLKGWLVAVPIIGATSAVSGLLSSPISLYSSIAGSGLMMLFAAAYTAFALGLFLVNPAFSEKSVRLFVNVVISVIVSIGMFVLSIAVISYTLGFSQQDPTTSMLYLQLVQTGVVWLVGTGLLAVGIKKISKVE